MAPTPTDNKRITRSSSSNDQVKKLTAQMEEFTDAVRESGVAASRPVNNSNIDASKVDESSPIYQLLLNIQGELKNINSKLDTQNARLGALEEILQAQVEKTSELEDFAKVTKDNFTQQEQINANIATDIGHFESF